MFYFGMDATFQPSGSDEATDGFATTKRRVLLCKFVGLGVLIDVCWGLRLVAEPLPNMRPRLEQVKVGMTMRWINEELGAPGDFRRYVPDSIFTSHSGGIPGNPTREALTWKLDDGELSVLFEEDSNSEMRSIKVEVRDSEPYPASLLCKIQWHLGFGHDVLRGY
jgi:hypothetical protein